MHGRALRRQPERPQVVAHRVVEAGLGQPRGLGPHHDPGQAVRRPLRRRPGRPQQPAPGGRRPRTSPSPSTCSGPSGSSAPAAASVSSWAWVTPARRTRSSPPRQGRPATIRSAVASPTPRTDPRPRRSTASPTAPPPSSDAPTSERFTWGRRTRTPWRRGVGHQRLGRPEPHGLRVEQPRGERRRIVQLQPRRGVHQVRERHRVRLGEAEVGERGERLEDLVGHRARHPARRHPVVEARPHLLHARRRALGRHGLAQLVGVGRAEPRDGDGHLHQLLLEERDPERALEDRLEQRVQVGDGLLAAAAPDVGVHRVALNGAGPDERDLDGDVVEGAGPHPGQGPHLGPALDLEDPDRVGPAQQVVDRALLGQLPEVDLDPVEVAHQVDHAVQRLEHAEAEQVELHQPDGGAVVLVPLQHAAPGHAPPLHRADLDHRPVAQHHAGRVDAEVARPVEHLGRQLGHQRRHAATLRLRTDRFVHRGGRRRPPPVPGVDAGRPGVHLLGGEAERLADVAHGRARPVRDDVGHLRRVAAAVALVHVLDDLLAPLRLDVHVDVRRPVTRRREEALEEQPEVDRVDVGDAERVADGRVGRRAAPLAVDVQPLAHLRDVPHHEEVAGEAELADHLELVGDLLPRAGHPLGLGRPVARRRALGHQLAQVALLVHALGDGEVGQPRRDEAQVEGAGTPELGGALDHAGPAGEAPGLLGGGAQAGRRGRRQPALELGQGAARPHGGERGGEAEPGRRGVVHVVGRHGVDTPARRRGAPARRCAPCRAGPRGPTAPARRWRGRTRRRGAPPPGRPPAARLPSARRGPPPSGSRSAPASGRPRRGPARRA